MAFNGSGVFVRLYSWVNDAAANIKIRADRMDNEMNGMAVGLTTCLTKDGQTTPTGSLPMAGFRHTGVGDAQARSDYASAAQLQDGKINWVAAGGTADVITASYTIPVTALADGQLFYVRAGAANATTTPTFNPSSLGAKTITKNGNQALVAGDIFGSGHELILRYRLSDTKFELMNPSSRTVTDATITTTDVTTNNVTSAKHGWAPKSPASATTFLNGAATPAYAAVKDSDLSTTDITTNNASITKHGFLSKLSNSATDYMDGTGNWSSPVSSPSGSVVNSLALTYDTYSSTASAFSVSDTAPNTGNGMQIFSQPYSAASATNKLRFRYNAEMLGPTTGCASALFAGSTCIASRIVGVGDATRPSQTYFEVQITPGSTSPVTYSLNFGPAGAGTAYINGDASGRLFGGTQSAVLVIEEIKA